MAKKPICIGDTVRSVVVGVCPPFVGVVVEEVGHRGGTWNVRDKYGQVWCRNSDELTLVDPVAEGVPLQ